MPLRARYSWSDSFARQLLTIGDDSRRMKPAMDDFFVSSSSGFVPVFPMCAAVIVTSCPQYEGSVRTSW